MLDKIKGGLVVSCQALPNEPLHSPKIMGRMAVAAQEGGALGIRANSVEDIKEIKKHVNLPIVGIIKKDFDNCEIYITPTKDEVKELIDVSCDMIAIDATMRNRPNGDTLKELVQLVHDHGKLAMADISTEEEALNAQKLNFDCVSTTLSGYTKYSPQIEGPDFKLVERLVDTMNIPVIAEGRIHSLLDAEKMSKLNPHAIVIGSAITRPQIITNTYNKAIQAGKKIK